MSLCTSISYSNTFRLFVCQSPEGSKSYWEKKNWYLAHLSPLTVVVPPPPAARQSIFIAQSATLNTYLTPHLVF